VTRYRCVDDQKAAGFPVTAACEAAGVSTSGFYDWHTREAAGPTDRQIAEAELVALIRDIFDASDGNYGVPRMHRELRRAGLTVNEKRVRRLMRLHGVAGRCRRRRCHTTFPGPDGYVIPDLIGRRFDPGAHDVAWVQDITYIATGEGWLYLASVLDLGSRRMLGYSMADHMRAELVLDALDMAVAARGGASAVAGVIAHADRGSQYTSNDYLDFCHTHQLRPSVGRTGVCWDCEMVVGSAGRV
jgi:transposase InsO family protein